MKVPPKRKGNTLRNFSWVRLYKSASMKVPPKRKGNLSGSIWRGYACLPQ